MADVLLGVLLTIAALGVAVLVWIWRRWESVASRVADVQVKVWTVVVKAIAAAVAAGGAYAAEDKANWWPPVTAGLLCVVVWEVVEKLVDARVKATDKVTKVEFAALARLCEERTELLDLLRSALENRCVRMTEIALDRGENPTVPALREALGPRASLKQVLWDLVELFAFRVEGTLSSAPNFRAGLYVARGGSLIPIAAADRNNPRYDVFRSYLEHEAAFRLGTGEKAAHAVRCVLRRETVIVADCVRASESGEFHYFAPEQAGYLRSMAAYFMGEVIDENGSPALAALVVDSNLPGYFAEEKRDSLEFTLREFAARIRIDMVLLALLTKSEPRDGTNR